jgi:septum formation topological specificity factor MinE
MLFSFLEKKKQKKRRQTTKKQKIMLATSRFLFQKSQLFEKPERDLTMFVSSF